MRRFHGPTRITVRIGGNYIVQDMPMSYQGLITPGRDLNSLPSRRRVCFFRRTDQWWGNISEVALKAPMLMMADLTAASNMPNELIPARESSRPSYHSQGCGSFDLAFFHQIKAAGTTMEALLKKIASNRSHKIRLHGLGYDRIAPCADATVPGCNRPQLCAREQHGAMQTADPVWTMTQDIPYCRSCTPRQRWFTVFREPLARAISAFTFCKAIHGHDPACKLGVALSGITPCRFIEIWGSQSLAAIAAIPTDPALILASRGSLATLHPSVPECLVKVSASYRPGGYQLNAHKRLALMRLCGLDDPTTAQGRRLLDGALRTLRNTFSFIGLAERWNETLGLLHQYTGCEEWRLYSNMHLTKSHGAEHTR